MTNTSNAQLDALFEKQKKAFAKDSNPDLEARLDRLRRLENAMVKNRKVFQESLTADFGSHHALVTDLFETGGVLGRNRYIQAMLSDWMQDSPRELNSLVHGSSKARVIRQPKGVIGNMAPWNFPIECALVMVNDMIAAGNRVIVKGSRLAQATSNAIADAISKEFDEDTLTVVSGESGFSSYFCTLPWDHLAYTGGPKIARSVMASASKNLTPVTLELGGKNPTVFTEDGVCPDLVERFLFNRVFKGGQVCTSPDYVLVPEAQLDDWVALAKEMWSGMYPKYIGHEDATGAINEHHYQRVLGYVEEARNAGHEVISLNGDQPDPETRQIPMYVVIDPAEDLDVMQEEMFGPVTAVKPYTSFDDALAYINSHPRPLAAYMVGRDDAKAKHFQQEVISGGIAINAFGLQGAEPALPFGGIGRSGMGCHSGLEGFLSYTHSKSVFECADDNPLMASLKGPYGDMTQAFADAIFPAE